jgi:hypothetical protein
MLLNPGVQLNLRGLSVDHVVAEGVLTDIYQPSDPCPVDLSNPDLKAFDPWAPFVVADSEETESDVQDGDGGVLSSAADTSATVLAPGPKDDGVETEVVVPLPVP